MKHTITLLLCLVLCIGMASCSSAESTSELEPTQAEPTISPTTAPTTPPITAPTQDTLTFVPDSTKPWDYPEPAEKVPDIKALFTESITDDHLRSALISDDVNMSVIPVYDDATLKQTYNVICIFTSSTGYPMHIEVFNWKNHQLEKTNSMLNTQRLHYLDTLKKCIKKFDDNFVIEAFLGMNTIHVSPYSWVGKINGEGTLVIYDEELNDFRPFNNTMDKQFETMTDGQAYRKQSLESNPYLHDIAKEGMQRIS